MTREEKVNYLIELIEFVEGEDLSTEYFKEFSDEKLDSEIDMYEYVSEK